METEKDKQIVELQARLAELVDPSKILPLTTLLSTRSGIPVMQGQGSVKSSSSLVGGGMMASRYSDGQQGWGKGRSGRSVREGQKVIEGGGESSRRRLPAGRPRKVVSPMAAVVGKVKV